MSRIDTIGQNGNDGEHYSNQLTWPVDKELIGRKVRFDGYVTGRHSHWDYKVGGEYTIKGNTEGDVGPENVRGNILSVNYGNDFKFTLLPENRIAATGGDLEYNHEDVAFKRTAADMVNHPPHYQADGIECIDAIRAALGPDGFVALCRGNAIKYAWRAGKKGDAAQDLRKAAWYLNRAADELTKDNNQ